MKGYVRIVEGKVMEVDWGMMRDSGVITDGT